MSVSETLLDVYRFTGNETVLEIYEKEPIFEEALQKRVRQYQSVKYNEFLNNLNADLVVINVSNLLLKYLTPNYLKKVTTNPEYLFICNNRNNFHRICDSFEGKKVDVDGVSWRQIKNRILKLGQFTVLAVFHTLKKPKLIENVESNLESYCGGRSGRLNGQRRFRNCLSVLFELIFIKHLKIKRFYPGFVIRGRL